MRRAAVILALTIVAVDFCACRKGEQDPALSFRSRKARFAGEWAVASMQESVHESNDDGFAKWEETRTTTVNGSTKTVVTTSAGKMTESTTQYSLRYNFSKDGTFTYEGVETDVITDTVSQVSPSGYFYYYIRTRTITSKTTGEGEWRFLSGVGELEDKESVGIYRRGEIASIETEEAFKGLSNEPVKGGSTENITTTSTFSDDSHVWNIVKLKNNEIILEREIDQSAVNTKEGSTEESYFKLRGSAVMILTPL